MKFFSLGLTFWELLAPTEYFYNSTHTHPYTYFENYVLINKVEAEIAFYNSTHTQQNFKKLVLINKRQG